MKAEKAPEERKITVVSQTPDIEASSHAEVDSVNSSSRASRRRSRNQYSYRNLLPAYPVNDLLFGFVLRIESCFDPLSQALGSDFSIRLTPLGGEVLRLWKDKDNQG